MSSSSAVKSATRCSARDARVRVSASSRCNSADSMRDCTSSPCAPLKRQDLIALNMPDLTMPVSDTASSRAKDVVVFMYSIPLLSSARNGYRDVYACLGGGGRDFVSATPA